MTRMSYYWQKFYCLLRSMWPNIVELKQSDHLIVLQEKETSQAEEPGHCSASVKISADLH